MKVVHTTESRSAFDAAIREGRLSADAKAENYAGKYMYVGPHRCLTHEACDDFDRDMFKHIGTRQYLNDNN